MERIVFSEKVISWFETLLTGRPIKVNLYKRFSDLENLTCGILQRSTLGPLLFLLQVSDK